MTSSIRAVAFDFDGLMFDTEKVYDLVGRKMLERRSHSLRPSVAAEMMGRPGLVALQIMIDAYGLNDTAQELEIESQELFLDEISQGVEPMRGLMELLDTIESAGITKAICTSSRPKMVLPLLRGADLEHRFSFMLTAEDVTRHKPDPQIYQTAAERMGVDPREMMVLEDSMIGCRAAVHSGAFAVAVPSKHVSEHDFGGVAFIADDLYDPRIFQALER